MFFFVTLIDCFYFLDTGGDAKHPFLIDLPDEIYKSLKIHMNTMFVATSQVRN